jgi:glycosyltransferase involved in cell wall biosynthesis
MTTPIRVLHLGSPNGLYGAERWILALVRHLDLSRVESHVGVIRDEPEYDPPLLHLAAADGLKTVAIDAPGRFNWAAVTALRQYIRANSIQVLHTHFYKTDIIGLLAGQGTSCKLLTTPHGWSTHAGLALRLYEALDRKIFRFFDAVAPLSPALATELAPYAGSKLHYIQNGVDIDEIDDTTSIAPEVAAWKQRNEYVIGYVGQLITRKGIDTLIKAFAQMTMTNSRLVLIGEGPQRGEMEILARTLGVTSRVEFLGYRTDRISLLRGFDVFALPSLLEGIPRCLMEAMAAGVPIVATDIPGCRELIEPDLSGILVPPGNDTELASAMKRLSDPALRAMYASAARARVMEHFSAAAMARAYTRLYTDLA